MKHPILFLIFIINSLCLSAQIDHRPFEDRVPVDESRKEHLFLTLNSFSFNRNYEYSNRFANDYTLFGTRLISKFTYYPNEYVALSAGILLQQDFGNNALRSVLPVISIKYHKNDLSFIMGAIEGNINHRYIEPLYSYERLIEPSQEYGTQLLVDRGAYFLDFWINWEKMIYDNSPYQEKFSAGLSSSLKLLNHKKWTLELPLQVILFHQGGKNVLNDDHVFSVVNSAVGLSSCFPLRERMFVNALKLEGYWLLYNANSHAEGAIKLFPYLTGNALMLNFITSLKYLDVTVNYFSGNQFINTKGNPLFSSLSNSIDHSGYFKKTRNILSLRFTGDYKLSNAITMAARIEFFKDTAFHDTLNSLDFVHTLYLYLHPSFLLSNKLKAW